MYLHRHLHHHTMGTSRFWRSWFRTKVGSHRSGAVWESHRRLHSGTWEASGHSIQGLLPPWYLLPESPELKTLPVYLWCCMMLLYIYTLNLYTALHDAFILWSRDISVFSFEFSLAPTPSLRLVSFRNPSRTWRKPLIWTQSESQRWSNRIHRITVSGEFLALRQAQKLTTIWGCHTSKSNTSTWPQLVEQDWSLRQVSLHKIGKAQPLLAKIFWSSCGLRNEPCRYGFSWGKVSF